MEKQLKKGYTTGVHTLMAFKSALDFYINTGDFCSSKTIKMDNDDLDKTKGCEIVVSIAKNKESLELNEIEHKPYELKGENGYMYFYAGKGVGVVTKKGLKPPVGYPAINPKPLSSLQECFASIYKKSTPLYGCVSVTDGEKITKETANEKVGVMGGISILGTTGFVKPISSSAYIDSVATEIEFALNNSYKTLYFTLGNSAFERAKREANEEAIIEIGNFVYDALDLAKNLYVKKVEFICGIGKMTKVAQGFKNTHNRFGEIDFELLQSQIKEELGVSVDIEVTKTVRGISEQLQEIGKIKEFYALITQKANEQIALWHRELSVEVKILEQKEVSRW